MSGKSGFAVFADKQGGVVPGKDVIEDMFSASAAPVVKSSGEDIDDFNIPEEPVFVNAEDSSAMEEAFGADEDEHEDFDEKESNKFNLSKKPEEKETPVEQVKDSAIDILKAVEDLEDVL